ncbi:MAG: response regulator [Chloroflexota bacterium]|nr:MAG: transcriptional regulator [Bellilinea sp.]
MTEKILIVDDDLETLRLVGLMLQRQGYQVISAKNGKEGMVLAVKEHPDLIVLDIMMPDVDGYQVARDIRANPETADIPILMFTAKSQVDDKVTGYEAGADDYLTKPVHPAELIAHIKALLSRTRARVGKQVQKSATVIGLLAAKGGMGTSTLTLNLALAYFQRTRKEIIAAEIRAGQGTWAGELNFPNAEGLNNLLNMRSGEVTRAAVEKELVRTTFGIRLLLANHRIKDFVLLQNAVHQLEAILHHLSTLGDVVFVDIGNPFLPGFEKVITSCDEMILIAEPQPFSLKRTNQLMDELAEYGFGKSKILNVVIVNRVRADLQLSALQIQEMLGKPITLVIPPAPEQSYHAALRNVPLIQLQPDGILSQQINRLAALYADRLNK